MAITWASRRHNYKTRKTMLSFQHPTPNFKTIKGEKKSLQTCCLCRLHRTTKIVLHCANHSSLLEHLVVQLEFLGGLTDTTESFQVPCLHQRCIVTTPFLSGIGGHLPKSAAKLINPPRLSEATHAEASTSGP